MQLEPNTQLLVTILADAENADEREEWSGISSQILKYAYDTSEAEYSLKMVKEPNALYEGR